MTANDAFFKERKPVAVFKHKLLEDYLTAWATKLSVYSKGSVAFLDGYAGTGQYEDGTLGSPLVAMNAAQSLRDQQIPKELRNFFVESDSKHFEELKKNVRKHPLGYTARLYSGDVVDHLDSVVREIGSSPLLVFLDPFGTSFDADLIKTHFLADPRMKVEVLLNVSIQAVWRIGGLLTSNTYEPHFQKSLERLDSALDGTWWRDRFIEARERFQSDGSARYAARAAREVSGAFANRLVQGTPHQALSVHLRKTTDSEPIFSLTLFHKHREARLLFIDSAARAHKSWRRAYWGDQAIRLNTQEGLFEVSTDAECDQELKALSKEGIANIQMNIISALEEALTIRVSDHLSTLYGKTIGTAGRTELRKAILALENDCRISVVKANKLDHWTLKLP